MSEKEAPETGKGSPSGPRWFVSKNPSLVLEVVAEKILDAEGNKPPHVRVFFKSEEKSEIHVGMGYLGTRNKNGSDLNANLKYGVHFVIDPGPRPKDGYEDDKDEVRADWRRTAKEKDIDRKVIDHIRSIYMYRNSPQDNRYRNTARLTELNWDPTEIRKMENRMVVQGGYKPMARPPEDNAPEETRAERTSSRPVVAGRRASAS